MKITVIALALLLTASFTPHAVTAHAATTMPRTIDEYEEGLADGEAYADTAAQQYGYGTTAYNNAISAEAARAQYNATHSETPVYWRAYRNGLYR